MALWILAIVNIFFFITFSKGFSLWLLIITLIISGLGILALKWFASQALAAKDLSAEIMVQVTELMEKIRPFCDEIFVDEINRITEPILTAIEEDFTKGLGWLWENNEIYLAGLQQGISETRAVIHMTETISAGSRLKFAKKLQEKLDQLMQIIDDIDRGKESNQAELEKHLQNKAQELKLGMSKEKEIFYEYVEKLLIQQIKDTEDCIEIIDYLNIDKLGEQFSVVIEKSIEARLSYFKDSIIKDLEYMSADIVGKMQKGALQLRNIFNEIDGLIENLIEDCHEDIPTSRRLRDSHEKILELKEQANDFLVTLAWQDILIEKRWQDVQVKLFMIKDQVLGNVSQEVTSYIITILEEVIPNFAGLASRPETTLVYKACLDAETVYQVSEAENMQDIISDNVYALLQFIRPVEIMVGAAIRFNETGISERRMIKDHLRQSEYMQIWEQVVQELKQAKPELLLYLDDVYPLSFASFCNSPYIRQKPENVNDAAWMLFTAAASGQNIGRDGMHLIGLLLFIHRLRNKYIHPLKSLPLPVDKLEEIEYIRYAAYKSIDILAGINLNGIVKNKII